MPCLFDYSTVYMGDKRIVYKLITWLQFMWTILSEDIPQTTVQEHFQSINIGENINFNLLYEYGFVIHALVIPFYRTDLVSQKLLLGNMQSVPILFLIHCIYILNSFTHSFCFRFHCFIDDLVHRKEKYTCSNKLNASSSSISSRHVKRHVKKSRRNMNLNQFIYESCTYKQVCFNINNFLSQTSVKLK